MFVAQDLVEEVLDDGEYLHESNIYLDTSLLGAAFFFTTIIYDNNTTSLLEDAYLHLQGNLHPIVLGEEATHPWALVLELVVD